MSSPLSHLFPKVTQRSACRYTCSTIRGTRDTATVLPENSRRVPIAGGRLHGKETGPEYLHNPAQGSVVLFQGGGHEFVRGRYPGWGHRAGRPFGDGCTGCFALGPEFSR